MTGAGAFSKYVIGGVRDCVLCFDWSLNICTKIQGARPSEVIFLDQTPSFSDQVITGIIVTPRTFFQMGIDLLFHSIAFGPAAFRKTPEGFAPIDMDAMKAKCWRLLIRKGLLNPTSTKPSYPLHPSG